MNLLGIDYGQKRIGVAYSSGFSASSITEYARGEAIIRLKKLTEELAIGQVIIGLTEGKLRSQTLLFGQFLEKKLGIPVKYWDETLSSFSARQNLVALGKSVKQRKRQEHQVAAALMLQSYLESHPL